MSAFKKKSKMAKGPKLFGKPIGQVIKRPGAFKAKAKIVGMSTCSFAKLKQGSPGLLGKQARLALTLMRSRGICK